MGKLIVVKFGSESVASKPGVDQERLNRYAKCLARLGSSLIVVTSGSVMAGKAEAPHISDEQVLAGLGSASIVMAWKMAFGYCGRQASQVLVTDHEIDDIGEGDTLKVGLNNDLLNKIIPIVNTNDKLSYEELKKRKWGGENDKLAAHVSVLMEADELYLLTGRSGVFDNAGQTIRIIYPDEHNRILSMVEERGSKDQGIYTKTLAATIAASAGIDAYIAAADEEIDGIRAGEMGTHFVAAA